MDRIHLFNETNLLDGDLPRGPWILHFRDSIFSRWWLIANWDSEKFGDHSMKFRESLSEFVLYELVSLSWPIFVSDFSRTLEMILENRLGVLSKEMWTRSWLSARECSTCSFLVLSAGIHSVCRSRDSGSKWFQRLQYLYIRTICITRVWRSEVELYSEMNCFVRGESAKQGI